MMKKTGSFYIPDIDHASDCEEDYGDCALSEQSIESLARKCVPAQFKRHCEEGLLMVNAAGEIVSGRAIWELYSQFCKQPDSQQHPQEGLKNDH